HFPKSYHLAGLGIASQLWLLILISFNFLQYASSGLSAQALGRQAIRNSSHSTELADILFRSLGLALILALILWLFKPFILTLGLKLLGAQPESSEAAYTYLNFRYYGIVFELMNYAFIGWFAGQGKTNQMMLVQLLISVINIAMTLTFVYVFDMGLKGVALGTVIGYAIGCMMSIVLAKMTMSNSASMSLHGITIPKFSKHRMAEIFAFDKMVSLFSLNKDIFIRTILLTLSFAWITRLSAQQGDLVMATNALLLQILSISAFALDGVAVAAESLSGQAAARQSRQQFLAAVKRTGIITFVLALGLTIIWAFVLPSFLNIMTNLPEVYDLALDYRMIATLLPLIGAGAYWLDGIMFGLTAGAKIRQVAIIVSVIFFPLTYSVYQIYGLQYAMPVVWFSVYWLLISRFVIAAIVLWRNQRSLIYNK
uniref:MATE family efflux transporter n=1 Tax=Psychrobacter sp. TaxID=56811 RepID=UPI0025E2835A